MKLTWDKYSDAYEAAEEEIRKKFSDYNESFLVYLRAKYSNDNRYYGTVTLLLSTGDWAEPSFVWETDWWEGEQDVELIAAYPISEIDLKPNF